MSKKKMGGKLKKEQQEKKNFSFLKLEVTSRCMQAQHRRRLSDPAAEPGHVGGADGLEEEVLGALLEAAGDPVGHVLRGHDHDGDPPELGRLLDALEELVPGHPGHPVVGDDHVHVGEQAQRQQLQRPRRRLHGGHCKKDLRDQI